MDISEDIDRMRAVFGNELCPRCNSEIGDEPRSAFRLAPAPEMVVVDCDECGAKYKAVRRMLNRTDIEYELAEQE